MIKFNPSDLTTKVFEVPKKLKNVTRWSRWVNAGSEAEDVLEHSFSQAFITIILCEQLKADDQISDREAYRALACAILHDMGEMEYGDQLDYKKTSEEEMRERDFVYGHLKWLDPHIRDQLIDIFDVQEGAKSDDCIESQKKENQIFGLAEKLCYFMYALRQYKNAPDSVNSQELMAHVRRRQSKGLLRRAQSLGLPSDVFPFLHN